VTYKVRPTNSKVTVLERILTPKELQEKGKATRKLLQKEGLAYSKAQIQLEGRKLDHQQRDTSGNMLLFTSKAQIQLEGSKLDHQKMDTSGNMLLFTSKARSSWKVDSLITK
jgi:hypothetical protein